MPLRGEVVVPGDKSISHRAAILAALASGDSLIRGYASGADGRSTLACLRALGTGVRQVGDCDFLVSGSGLREAPSELDCGNSGTTMRLLSGVLAAWPFLSILTGDSSLRGRPMARVVEPLTRMGARIWGREQGRYAPLAILGGGLRGIDYSSPVASAQVKSAVLLAGLRAEGRTSVREPEPSRDHTERMLARFGVEVAVRGRDVSVAPAPVLTPCPVRVPGDLSSAAFLIAAALLVEGSRLVVRGVGLNPTRAGFLRVLERSGAPVRVLDLRDQESEPVGDLEVSHARLRPFTVGAEEVPSLVDEIPILAVLATQAEGTTVIGGAGELRHKESDRLRTMAAGLAAMGAEVEESQDGLRIHGPCALRGGALSAEGDHRVAMALAVAALVARGATAIEGAEAVDISYPGFFETLYALGGQ